MSISITTEQNLCCAKVGLAQVISLFEPQFLHYRMELPTVQITSEAARQTIGTEIQDNILCLHFYFYLICIFITKLWVDSL